MPPVEDLRGGRLPQRPPAERQGHRHPGRLGGHGNCPEGDPKDAPPPASFPQGWQLGTPDLVLTAGRGFSARAERQGCVPLLRAADRTCPRTSTSPPSRSGPAIRSVVHHVLLFIDTAGQGPQARTWRQERKEEPPVIDPHTGAAVEIRSRPRLHASAWASASRPQAGMGGWAPGRSAAFLPDGVGISSAEELRHRHAGPLPPQWPGGKGPHADRPVFRQEKGRQAVPGVGRSPAARARALRLFLRHPAGAERLSRCDGDMWASEGLHPAHRSCRTCT